MNDLGNFEQFLSTSTAQISIGTFIINLIITAVLSYLLGLLYSRFGNSLSNRRSFSKNFVLLAITTMIVITIVKSSLALSLGLVGALSIVRFRAAIKEPEELSYLFLNIAIGLGMGADQKVATLIGFVGVALYLVAKGVLYKKRDYENQSLLFTVGISSPDANFTDTIVAILKENTLKSDLKRFDEDASTLEASFIIETSSFEDINTIKSKIRNQYKDATISLIDNSLAV